MQFTYRHYKIWFTKHFCSEHMKAWVATEVEVSDWQTHFCCAAAAASTLPIPPRAIEKLIASHFADPRTAFFLPLKQRKKKWKCSSPCFHLVCKKVIDRRRPLLHIVPKVHLFVQKLLYNLHGKLRKLGWLDFFRLECVVYRLKYSKSTFGAKNGVKK